MRIELIFTSILYSAMIISFCTASIYRGVIQEEFGSLREPQHGLGEHADKAGGGTAEVRVQTLGYRLQTIGYMAQIHRSRFRLQGHRP